MTQIADDKRIAYEAAAFRKLLEHLREHSDVQNIDMMNLAGFCRNCLSNWYQEAANADGSDMNKEEARAEIYGMPYQEWREKHQKPASEAQLKSFSAQNPDHNS